MDAKTLKHGKIYDLKHELRLTKLRIRKAQNEIQLATADFLEFADLELELPTLEKAVVDYKTAVKDHTRLQNRLKELER